MPLFSWDGEQFCVSHMVKTIKTDLEMQKGSEHVDLKKKSVLFWNIFIYLFCLGFEDNIIQAVFDLKLLE